jgi:hypothetical protein
MTPDVMKVALLSSAGGLAHEKTVHIADANADSRVWFARTRPLSSLIEHETVVSPLVDDDIAISDGLASAPHADVSTLRVHGADTEDTVIWSPLLSVYIKVTG